MSPINIKSNRIEAIDIAKGIGILLMVMGHTGFGGVFDKLIHTFHMPLFFFVSGYFYRPDKTKDFRQYLLRQINLLIVPYLAFALFYELLHYLYVGEMSWGYFFKSLLSSNHNRIDVAGALWFLMALFSAKIVYSILDHNIKGLFARTIVIGIISLSAMTFRRFDIYLPLGLDTALSMLIVIHLGYLLYVYRDRNFFHRLSNLSPWLLIAVLALFLISGLYNDHVIVRRNKYGIEVLYFLSCMCGILLTMNISSLLSNAGRCFLRKVKDMFAFWGRESIVFLLVNELFLFITSEMFIVIGFSRDTVEHNYWFRLLFMLVAMGLMSILALFSGKSLLGYIFGKKRLIKGNQTTKKD